MIYFRIHGLSFITITYLIKTEIPFWTELSCIFVPKSRMVQLWIISVNLVFVKYVNTKDSLNKPSFYSFLTKHCH